MKSSVLNLCVDRTAIHDNVQYLKKSRVYVLDVEVREESHTYIWLINRGYSVDCVGKRIPEWNQRNSKVVDEE